MVCSPAAHMLWLPFTAPQFLNKALHLLPCGARWRTSALQSCSSKAEAASSCTTVSQQSTVSPVLQSEMEDLCFAVLQPKDYRSLRQQLDRLWGTQSFPDLSRVLEAAFGGSQQTERVIKQLAGRRESPQELALRVAYSSNAVNAAKLLAPRKVGTPCNWGHVHSTACITGSDASPWQQQTACLPGLPAVHSVHRRQCCT